MRKAAKRVIHDGFPSRLPDGGWGRARLDRLESASGTCRKGRAIPTEIGRYAMRSCWHSSYEEGLGTGGSLLVTDRETIPSSPAVTTHRTVGGARDGPAFEIGPSFGVGSIDRASNSVRRSTCRLYYSEILRRDRIVERSRELEVGFVHVIRKTERCMRSGH
jgi:hypothetical protein